MPEPEPPSYARRFLAKLRRETSQYTKQKLLTGASVGTAAVVIRLALGKCEVIALTQDQTREIWINLLILLGAYALIFAGSFIVNLVRTPVLLDKDRADEIADLKEKLRPLTSSQDQKQIKLRLAELMERELGIRERLERAQNDADTIKVLSEMSEWISDTVALLKDSGEPTDAVVFAQVINMPPSGEQVNEFRHIHDEQRRGALIRLAMHHQTLQQIREKRRL
jgi:hypothetical protein